jgi:hypothetical protein
VLQRPKRWLQSPVRGQHILNHCSLSDFRVSTLQVNRD